MIYRAEGYVDYVLWSTFRPEYLDIDQELEMECLDSGMVLSKSLVTAAEMLADCCRDAGLSSAEILLSD